MNWYIVYIEDSNNINIVKHCAKLYGIKVWSPLGVQEELCEGYLFVDRFNESFADKLTKIDTRMKYMGKYNKFAVLSEQDSRMFKRKEKNIEEKNKIYNKINKINSKIRNQRKKNKLKKLNREKEKARISLNVLKKNSILKKGIIGFVKGNFLKYRCRIIFMDLDIVKLRIYLRTRKLVITAPRYVIERIFHV